MELPKCYDPPLLASQREARWDDYLSTLPRCTRCREPVLSETYLAIPEPPQIYCPRCVEAMTKFNENLEVT